MYERRLKVFLAIMALGVIVLLVRLVDVQLLRGDAYRRRAEETLTWVRLLPTVRGKLLDRSDRVLAVDQPCYEFCLPYPLLRGPGREPEQRKAYERWVRRRVRAIARAETGGDRARAGEIFRYRLERTWTLPGRMKLPGGTRNEMVRAAEHVVRRVQTIRERVGVPVREEFQPHSVIGGLSEAQAVALRGRLGEMVASATVRTAHRRRYPYGATACHIIGRVGPVTPENLRRNNGADDVPLREKTDYYFPGDRIGKFGAEKGCEDLLRGSRGYLRGREPNEILQSVPPDFGQSLHLTLDVELQRALHEALGRPGAIVVLNVADDEARGLRAGEVLAMVSRPGFDLNAYEDEYERLVADRAGLPLWNRAVAVRYPPGSTVKPLAALAGLTHGVITPETTITCNGYLHNPNAFRCWIWTRYKTGHGPLNVVGALEHSCNVFFYEVGERLNVRRQVAFLARLGFADPPGTGLPEERAGHLPDPRRARYVGDARFLAIGQGRILATPLHVANAMATLARGGLFVSPLLVRELGDRQQRRRLDVSDAHVDLVREGLYRVVNSPNGTAYKYARVPGIEVCGKTGTAETAPRRVDSNNNGRIDAGDRIVRSGDTAWFVGFAPYRKPRVAFAVLVEYAEEGGGATCGPIARKVVTICRKLGYL